VRITCELVSNRVFEIDSFAMIVDIEDPALINYKEKLNILEQINSSTPSSRNSYNLAIHIHQNAVSQDDLTRVEQLFESMFISLKIHDYSKYCFELLLFQILFITALEHPKSFG